MNFSSIKLFSTVGCHVCEEVKTCLDEQGIKYEDITITSSEGVQRLRKYYAVLKERIKRHEDGSMPIPIILFLDNKDEVIDIAYNTEEVKEKLH